MDKLVSIKGLVIRTTPIIPDMKDGMSLVLLPHKLLMLTRSSILPLQRLQLRSHCRD
jgi:hypothetical protein